MSVALDLRNDAVIHSEFAGIYRYDAVDRAFLNERVAQFRDQVERRLSGALSEEEFRPLRLMNGLYLQLHAYMLRIAVPYGALDSAQFRGLARVARRFDKGYGHFTTRQNIQFNWLKLEDIPDVMAELARVDLHGIQTSGNCIRNTTADQFAGAAADEIVDGRVYAEIIRQWSTLHPEFSFLPRKFKIAISGGPDDRAAIRVHDIGILAKRDEAGTVGFEIYAGGGLGRTPAIGVKLRDFVLESDLISYLEAILRVYNAYGRRDNIYKARIKILVHELGAEKFTAAVEAEFARMDHARYAVDQALIAAVRERFPGPPFADLPAVSTTHQQALSRDPAFARWCAVNLHEHKMPGYTSVVVSLKPVGGIPGDASADQLDALADLADQYSFGDLRVTHEQNLVLPHVRLDDVHDLYAALDRLDLSAANIGLVTDIIACPGLDYCSLANARSIPLAQAISARVAELGLEQEVGLLHLNISGCINACGHHHVGAIGILGVDKKGKEFYQITLGGSAGSAAEGETRLGDIIGASLPYDEVVGAIETLLRTYLSVRAEGETFLHAYQRIGMKPFKEALYGRA